jgi:hypothetical protein
MSSQRLKQLYPNPHKVFEDELKFWPEFGSSETILPLKLECRGRLNIETLLLKMRNFET